VSALLGPEKLDSPFGLGKIAPGGFPDVTYVQIIHGILLAATCRLPRGKNLCEVSQWDAESIEKWRTSL